MNAGQMWNATRPDWTATAESSSAGRLVEVGLKSPLQTRVDFRSWILVALVLVASLLIRFSIAATLPLVDPTEGRYAEISQEMAQSGDWVTPRLWLDGQDVPFLGKPPLFFWSAALSIRWLGPNELAVRLPSLAAVAALLFLMYWIVGWYLGRHVATSALIITVTCPLVFGAAGTVILDLHLTLFVVGALLSYLASALERDPKSRKGWSLAVFLCLAGGVLTKGPVALLLFGLPVLLWTVIRRRWWVLRQQMWSVGIPVFVVLVVPWFVLAELRNPGFIRYFFINENLLRYLTPEYGDLYGTGHSFPHGTALLMFLAASLPWSPVAAWILIKRGGAGIREAFSDDVSLFLFLGFASNVAFWCLARQLLATYLLPTLPLFAIWTAYAVVPERGHRRRLFRLGALAAVLWAAMIVTASSVASKDSTRAVLAEATEIARQYRIPGEVVFAGRTPYSAKFYAPRAIDDHPREPPSRTITEAIDANKPHILILHDADVDAVPERYRGRLHPMASDPHWFYLVTPTTDAAIMGDSVMENEAPQIR